MTRLKIVIICFILYLCVFKSDITLLNFFIFPKKWIHYNVTRNNHTLIDISLKEIINNCSIFFSRLRKTEAKWHDKWFVLEAEYQELQTKFSQQTRRSEESENKFRQK